MSVMSGYAQGVRDRREQLTREQLQGLGLFDGRPQLPPAGDSETRTLPLRTTIEERYQAWRDTLPGKAAFALIEQLALEELADQPTRIAVRFHVEVARRRLKATAKINDNFIALIARDLRELHPALKPLIELRERRAT